MLAILGVAFAVSIPNLQRQRVRYSTVSSAREILELTMSARFEALRRHRPTGLEFDVANRVVLDIGLPGALDGIDVCRRLREQGFQHPILFLSSRHEEVDKLTGFGVGGDDYVVKPAPLAEMDARIHSALRRCSGTLTDLTRTVSWSNVVVDLSTHTVTVDGEEVSLSAREMELLRYFVLHRGVVLGRERLLEEVWHYDSGVSSRTLDTHVLKLRRKLRDGHDGVRHFQTVRGVGYLFDV